MWNEGGKEGVQASQRCIYPLELVISGTGSYEN